MNTYGGRKPQLRKLTMSEVRRALESEELTSRVSSFSAKAATEPRERVVHQECWITPSTRQPHSVRPTATPTPRRDVIVVERRPFRPNRAAVAMIDAAILHDRRVSIY